MALQTLLALVEKHNFAGDRCQIVVINRLPGAGLGMKALTATLKHPVQAVVPYAAESCIASARAGNPLVIHQSNDLASVILTELAGRLAGIQILESSSPHTLARPTAPAPGEVSKFVFPSIPPRSS
jgi:MinD-like ATPase involved in chromosome partitioning or flagellar assembly